jgi:tRNA A-37 threonylcarbamoyl transferase component Bud32
MARWGAFASTVAGPTPDPGGVPPSVPDYPTFEKRYTLQATLGEGGMGIVRLAADRKIGREIAVKTMHAGKASRDIARRFLREARVQGQLEHPAIVPVHDLGRDATGSLYFTMRRVRGVTFAEIIERLRAGEPATVRSYSRRKLLSAFASVCGAVHFAHTSGVVHRDLKPANVMLGYFGEVYVLDWGVAKVAGVAEARPAADDACLPAIACEAETVAGALVGTPGYMAPEQLQATEPVDGRADVYTLGAVLFELLCFEPLHRSNNLAKILVSTLKGTDARLSIRAPHADVPPELEAIVVRATALHPADRFRDVGELRDALECFLDGDRDLERRVEASRAHTALARALAGRALAEGTDATDARRAALREVGRALAFDPANAEAMGVLVRLLTEPPRKMPQEALANMREEDQGARRATARGALFGYLAWFAFVPFGFWMGVRNPAVAAAASALWALAAVAAYLTLRLRTSGRPHILGIVMTATAACVTSAVCGPYVLVPTMAVINVILWLLLGKRSQRPSVIGLGVLTILVPAALEWSHGLHFYNFHEGRVTILQGMLDFPPAATHAFLLATSLTLVGVAAVVVSRFRDHLIDTERRLQLQAWQLRQLVPGPAVVPGFAPGGGT